MTGLRVAHSFDVWLPPTMTWAATQVRAAARGRRRSSSPSRPQNLDQFPFAPLYTTGSLDAAVVRAAKRAAPAPLPALVRARAQAPPAADPALALRVSRLGGPAAGPAPPARPRRDLLRARRDHVSRGPGRSGAAATRSCSRPPTSSSARDRSWRRASRVSAAPRRSCRSSAWVWTWTASPAGRAPWLPANRSRCSSPAPSAPRRASPPPWRRWRRPGNAAPTCA